jgi:hypothetical protein
MSIEQIIQNEANLSVAEVKERAQDEIEDEDLRGKKLANDGIMQDMGERKEYTHKIFVLICMWLVLVGIVLIASGNGNLHYSDSVLITLLTTTTANVIGLFVFVAKYLFQIKLK